ncbi:MAG: molybdopterin-dependent oxidoreductase [Chthoniobacterales bacterium]
MSATATEQQLINVQVDGEWKQFPKGTRLIEACMKSGKYVPHYCYHPKLSSPGNCRMCLIEMGMPKMDANRKPEMGEDGRPIINWSPRPAISCATEVAEGMGVRTESPLVEECRKGVMEFLLINHPLDCPICDQAGECRLQEFSVEFGKGDSRFLEEKVKKPKQEDIGKHIVLDDERCIMCSRCVRFMQEIAKDDVLGFLDRGSHTTLSVYPGKRLDNNYSLNTVDICPVGALTSKDFRFKMRVWFLTETKSIDVNCGTGSNILIGTRENVVYRITPRENDFVNSCWMPDSHRMNFHYINDEARLKTPAIKGIDPEDDISWEKAIETSALKLRQHSASEIAVIASARMTNEELFLAKKLIETLKTENYDIVPRFEKGDGFLIADDRNPNTAGAQLLGVTGTTPGAKLTGIVQGVKSGQIKALICLGEDVTKCGLTEEDLAKLQTLIVTAILPTQTTAHASVVLPVVSFVEKRGSMINIKNRIQRLNKAMEPVGDTRDDWEVLRDLIQALGGGNGIYLIEDLFKQMAAGVPALSGLSLSKIGDLGVDLAEKISGGKA